MGDNLATSDGEYLMQQSIAESCAVAAAEGGSSPLGREAYSTAVDLNGVNDARHHARRAAY